MTAINTYNLDTSFIEVVAHRGFASIFPENTLPALYGAFELGAHTIEIDVHHTRDGIPVVMHDDTVNRTTNGTGKISELTLTQIKTLDAGSWFGAQYAGTSVPTLSEVLQLCHGRGNLQLELKETVNSAQASNILKLIRYYHMSAHTMIISFSFENLILMRSLDPSIAIGYLCDNCERCEQLSRLGNAYVLFDFEAVRANPELVAQGKQSGLGVGVWTINTQQQAAEAQRLGICKITSNIPLV